MDHIYVRYHWKIYECKLNVNWHKKKEIDEYSNIIYLLYYENINVTEHVYLDIIFNTILYEYNYTSRMLNEWN